MSNIFTTITYVTYMYLIIRIVAIITLILFDIFCFTIITNNQEYSYFTESFFYYKQIMIIYQLLGDDYMIP